MNVDNRRLREIQQEKHGYEKLLDEAKSIHECLVYQGKIEILEKEEKDILSRYDVII